MTKRSSYGSHLVCGLGISVTAACHTTHPTCAPRLYWESAPAECATPPATSLRPPTASAAANRAKATKARPAETLRRLAESTGCLKPSPVRRPWPAATVPPTGLLGKQRLSRISLSVAQQLLPVLHDRSSPANLPHP